MADNTELSAVLALALAQLATRTPYQLALDADCANPNSHTSAGAALLDNVRDAVIEAVKFDPELATEDGFNRGRDITHEIADAAPSVYTGQKWAEFADVGAYLEDISELASDSTDMDNMGSVALYVIAERLATTLFGDIQRAVEDGEAMEGSIRQTVCVHCDLEVEGGPADGWRDRGGNTSCVTDGQNHVGNV